MHLIYRKEEAAKAAAAQDVPPAQPPRRLWQNALLFAAMVGILVFANWARSGDVRAVFLCCPGGLATYEVEGRVIDRSDDALRIVDTRGQEHVIPRDRLERVVPLDGRTVQDRVHAWRWAVVAVLAAALAWMVIRWLRRPELGEWAAATWGFAKQILPLLLIGVLVAGFLLGRPGHEGFLPSRYVEMLVGDSPEGFLAATGWRGAGGAVRAVWPVWTSLFASVLGAFMYFATLTEVPILQGLIGAGMGKGPALALLLAGPALSLPNMLVIASVLGARKTAVFASLVVAMATVSGVIYGAWF
jgi:hypothetical protein